MVHSKFGIGLIMKERNRLPSASIEIWKYHRSLPSPSPVIIAGRVVDFRSDSDAIS